MNKFGFFVISLDFELYWGIRDKKTIKEYGNNILGVWEVVPKLLELFKRYNIHATWATVGAMMSEDKEELERFLPNNPMYIDENLSPFNSFFENIDNINKDLVYGKKLLKLVSSYPYQEIGTHTFSHYYCLEEGQTKRDFLSDLKSAISIAKHNNIELSSFIFPRHQINQEYLKILPEYGIKTYRGTEKIWYHSAARGKDEGFLKRIIRYFDYFIKLGSHHCQDLDEIKKGELFEIRASRWLRPYSPKLEYFDFLKIRRIKRQMTYAAQNNKIFHLWFHPHDIGINIEKNFAYLVEIFTHYSFLQKKYGFESKNMKEITELLG